MQTKKIIIFGDSFADPEDRQVENKQITAWYEHLNHDYEITNHALAGTGPHWSFKEYYNFISSDEKKEDYICWYSQVPCYRWTCPKGLACSPKRAL